MSDTNTPADLARKVPVQNMDLSIAVVNGIPLPATFKETVEFAQVMASGGVAVPKHLRLQPGACLAVIQTAMAWGMDPWLVARKTYSVNDNLAFEAQLIAAVLQARAPVKEKVWVPVYAGEGADLTCTITVHHRDTGEEITVTSPRVGPRLGKDVKEPAPDYDGIWPKNSPLWRFDERQQLFYYTIRLMGRRYFSGIMNGVYDVEETYAMRDITPKGPQPNLLNEDEPVREGEVLEPKPSPENIIKQAHEKMGADQGGQYVELVLTRTGTGPSVETVVVSALKKRLLASLELCFDPTGLKGWEDDNLSSLAELPPEDEKEVRKALGDKNLELME